MNKTATVRARIEAELKKEVEILFRKLGLSTTEAINIFYRQVKLRQGLPFPVIIPNKTTTQVIEDTNAGKNIIYCLDENEMFEQLEI